MGLTDEFFTDLDRRWQWPAPKKTSLRSIGSAALMLQTGYVPGTKDGDVVETADLTE